MSELDKIIEKIKEQFDGIDKSIAEINRTLQITKEGYELNKEEANGDGLHTA